jgi:hypothetical protein
MRIWEDRVFEARSRHTGSCSANTNYAHFTRWEREQGGLVSAELEGMVTRDATREASQVGQGLEGRSPRAQLDSRLEWKGRAYLWGGERDPGYCDVI